MSKATQKIKNGLTIACAASVAVFCVSTLASIAIDAVSYISGAVKSADK